jgi:hypothetical protein
LTDIISHTEEEVGFTEGPWGDSSYPGAFALFAPHEILAPPIRRAVGEGAEHRLAGRRLEDTRGFR